MAVITSAERLWPHDNATYAWFGVNVVTALVESFDQADLDWLEFLLRLKATCMSIGDIQRFAQLRAAGTATVADRLAMLPEHRGEL